MDGVNIEYTWEDLGSHETYTHSLPTFQQARPLSQGAGCATISTSLVTDLISSRSLDVEIFATLINKQLVSSLVLGAEGFILIPHKSQRQL